MRGIGMFALAFAASAWAGEERKMVGVPGTRVEFPVALAESVGGKPAALRLTGTALRTKAIFNVYAIASYVAADAQCKTAEDLAAADVPKRLALVFEREVAGKDMAAALRAGVEANHPGAFAAELKACDEQLAKETLSKGMKVALTHLPGVGVEVMLGDSKALRFDSVKFSQAVWETYLGKKNLGDKLKRGLTSRL